MYFTFHHRLNLYIFVFATSRIINFLQQSPKLLLQKNIIAISFGGVDYGAVYLACRFWPSFSRFTVLTIYGHFPLVMVKNEGSSKPEYVSDFDSFAEILRTSAQDVILDSELTAADRHEFEAYSSLMLQDFYPALLHLLWLDQWNYDAVTSHWYASHLFFPYSLIYLEKRRAKVRAYVEARGRSEKNLLLDAMSTINLLSAKLGDNKYFYGDKPSSLDALIFGYLAPLMKMPLPSDRLQLHLLSFANLVRFVESIISIYLPLTESQLRQQSASRDLWLKRRSRAQKAAERLNIRRQTLEQEEKVPLRDTILFAVAAITLSLLFAVHTGLVRFQLENDSVDLD